MAGKGRPAASLPWFVNPYILCCHLLQTSGLSLSAFSLIFKPAYDVADTFELSSKFAEERMLYLKCDYGDFILLNFLFTGGKVVSQKHFLSYCSSMKVETVST